MIKCPILVEGNDIYCKGKIIYLNKVSSDVTYIVDDELFLTLEQAIKYCMEN